MPGMKIAMRLEMLTV